ncbi:MAG: TIR domain-containing protein [Clostridia bacterium]|nr:TIR domain-containing protein [Clostridia bacterium]
MNRPKLFISYRREDGAVLARLLYDRLVAKGFIVFYDIESLGSGRFDTRIYERIEECDNFILVLSPKALLRCVNEDDWVRMEIKHALDHNKNIIHVLTKGFSFPDNLPQEIAHITTLNGVDFESMDFMDARIDKLISFFTNADQLEPFLSSTSEMLNFSATIQSFLKRTSTFLEYGEWENANEYCEKVLDMDSENAEAYLFKMMSELHVSRKQDLENCKESFEHSQNYPKIMRFADESLKKELRGYIEAIKSRNEFARLDAQYTSIVKSMKKAETETEYKEIAKRFSALGNFKNASELSKQALEKAEAARKDIIYQKARQNQRFDDIPGLENAILAFQKIPDWRDSQKQIEACKKRIAEIEEKVDSMRKQEVYKTACRYKNADTPKSLETALFWFQKIPDWRDVNEQIEICKKRIYEIESAQKNEIYEDAQRSKQKDEIPDLNNAIVLLQKISDWRDAQQQIESCKKRILEIEQDDVYHTAVRYQNNDTIEDLEKAIEQFLKIPDWKDSQSQTDFCRKRIEELKEKIRKKQKAKTIAKILISLICIGIASILLWNQVIIPMQKNSKYDDAVSLMAYGRYEKAIPIFRELNGYKDSVAKIKQCNDAIAYKNAVSLMNSGKYKEAIKAFEALGDYKDSAKKAEECKKLV